MSAQITEVEWRSTLEDRVTRSNAMATLIDRYQAGEERPVRNIELAAMAILRDELRVLENLVTGETMASEPFTAPPGSQMAKLEGELRKAGRRGA